MSATDYIIDLLLVGLVLRQIRPRPLTPRSIVLPAVLLVFAGLAYLKAFPTAGNDILLDAILVIAGAVCGVVSALTTKLWVPSPGVIMAEAGVAAAAAWILGTGLRLGFDIWAHTRGGERSLIGFSVDHSISAADAWTTAFVLMAFAQVLSRVGILQFLRLRLARGPLVERGSQ